MLRFLNRVALFLFLLLPRFDAAAIEREWWNSGGDCVPYGGLLLWWEYRIKPRL